MTMLVRRPVSYPFIGLLGALLLIASPVWSVEPNACDLAVGHPSDPQHLGPGVPTDKVVTHVAIPACRAALEADPGNPRLQYQLGRALYYWSEANGADTTEAMTVLQQAADQQYTQAMFVVGLLRKYAGDACAGRALIKAAADQGLKSGRLTYVSDSLAGTFAACGERIAADQTLLDYVTAAEQQAEGYYERMLAGNLKRELLARMKR